MSDENQPEITTNGETTTVETTPPVVADPTPAPAGAPAGAPVDAAAELKRRAELKENAMNAFKRMRAAGNDPSTAAVVHANAGVFTGGTTGVGILMRAFKEISPGSKSSPWTFTIMLLAPEGLALPYDDPDTHKKGAKPEFPVKPIVYPAPAYQMEHLGTYGFKMFKPTNTEMRAGTVVRLAGMSYTFYRKVADGKINQNFTCRSCVPEKMSFEEAVRSIPPSLRGLDKRVSASHHNQMLAILGEVQFASLERQYDPTPAYVFEVDQTMDVEKIGARIEAGEDNFTVVMIGKLPTEAECFKYTFKRGDPTASYDDIALKGPKPDWPLTHTVFSVRNGELHTSGASWILFREDVAQLGVVVLEDFTALGPNLFKGHQYVAIGVLDEDKSDILDNPDDEVFESQMQLHVRAVMDVAKTVRNVGVRFSLEAAQKNFARLKATPELFVNDADAEVRKHMNVREATAVNLSGITGDVRPLVEAAKTGEVELYLVCNHTLGPKELAELQAPPEAGAEKNYDDVWSKLEKSVTDKGYTFVRKWYAVTTTGRPIMNLVKPIANGD